MTTPYREYHTVDKSTWHDGPWKDEPDKVQWADEDTGLPCLAVRSHSGALCGYIGVPDGHPLYGRDFQDIPDELHWAAHRGVNYAAACSPADDEAYGICHVPGEGDPDHVWWFGFDCAHVSSDHVPGYFASRPSFDRTTDDIIYGAPESYKTLAYVRERCREMAAVVKALS